MVPVTESKPFNPATTSPEDFCGLPKEERDYLADNGFRFEALKCVRFLDTRESYPWFYREHELLGYVFAVTDHGLPCDEPGVLRTAYETFGVCDVLW